jgi:transcription-repair coupling factor (superfamily II helicase)
MVISLLPASGDAPLLIVAPTDEEAAYLHSDLLQFVDDVRLYPSSDVRPYDPDHLPDTSRIVARSEILDALHVGSVTRVVTSADAIYERIVARDEIEQGTIRLEVGQELDPEQLTAMLTAVGFEYVDFAEEPGDLAVRGGIVDVFPYSGSYPIRLEFFGDDIDSIREFDPTSQRSISDKRVVRIFPNVSAGIESASVLEPLTVHLPPSAGIVIVRPRDVFARADGLFADQNEACEVAAEAPWPASHYFLTSDEVRASFANHKSLEIGPTADGQAVVEFGTRPQPDFGGHLTLLRERLATVGEGEHETLILCDSRSQRARLEELLEKEISRGHVTLELASVHEGFELAQEDIWVYTDHQIFNRYHRPSTKKAAYAKAGLSLREIRSLQPGDFVVHVDYGIGRFEGMRKIDVRGRTQEAVCLKYKDNDTLFVNVSALHKLNKYKGKEGTHPGLTKLGSGQWERTKARTRKRVKDIARDLIKLYAQRHATKGYGFSPDTLWQQEMEASFEFEDTPDQAEASTLVKEDMIKPVPMDRLVCGDVGFGKTEIAIRAAFKAVQDGKQVAVLVPTTVLASQHLETFTKRLQDYPVRCAMLSRFVSTAEQKETLAKVTSGDVDVLIGTHRIVSKDVQFKDLGLMIIDEEQRFGVGVKEKLRQMRVNVDTLTLTATPIPRTLQFSLLGARDLSIVGTPPPNRQPIVTEIHAYSTDLIRDAIRYELSRGGQVFFIHNRVQSIEEMSASLRALVPGARMQVAHGQMKASQLEKVMLGFKQHEFDILVSTNIIENGLDIANANTIIINHANRFGLSELHQIRGRVGRSDRKAFCYLLVPSIHGLTREARQRLTAIEEFSDLGSGFNLAMRDLDIRGAGNLLGAEQSGFIADVGFETYHRILDDAVRELRAEEFSELFGDRPVPPPSIETTVEIDADALIPADYLLQENERLNVYKRISEAADAAALEEIRSELEDRFGPPPDSVTNLLAAARIRAIGQQFGLTKIVFKRGRLFLTCPSQEQYPHFYVAEFHAFLERLTHLPNRYVLKETKAKKLQAIVQDVASVDDVESILVTITTTSETIAEPSPSTP